MLHNNPLFQTLATPTSAHTVALHPVQAKLAHNQSRQVIVQNYRDHGQITALHKMQQTVVKTEFSPCGFFLFMLTQETTVDQNKKHMSCYRLAMAQADGGHVFAEALLQSADPLKLEPANCFLQFEYSYRNQEQLKFVWVCLNQKVKQADKFQTAGGYSLICLAVEANPNSKEPQFKHVISSYLESFEHALDFKLLRNEALTANQPYERSGAQFRVRGDSTQLLQASFDEKATVMLLIADRTQTKLFYYNMINQSITLKHTVKFSSDVSCAVIERIHPDNTILVVALFKESRDCATIDFASSKELYRRKPDHKYFFPFTAVALKDDLAYIGAENGSVYVIESFTGAFVKEIPFQFVEFQTKRLGGVEVANMTSPVNSLKVNLKNHLLVWYTDRSYLLLDQEAKLQLSAEQGMGHDPIIQLKWLPIANSDVFFGLTQRELIVFQRVSVATTTWQFKVIKFDFNNKAFDFDIDPTISYILVAYTNGYVEKIELKTLTKSGQLWKLIPDHLRAEQKSVHVFVDNTVAVVLKDGSSFLFKKSRETNQFMLLTQVFKRDQKQTANSKLFYTNSIQHQKVEFLEAQKEDNLRVLVLSKPDQIDLISVEISQDQTRKQVTQFFRTQGPIADFQVHASFEYVLALCSSGFIYIFFIADGGVRAKIPVEPNSMKIELDASGMFVSLHTPRETVQVFEIGTGRRVYEFTPPFGAIGKFTYSSDTTKFFITDKSCLTVNCYEIDPKLACLSLRTLKGMQQNPNFWSDYPIQLNSEALLTPLERTNFKRLQRQQPGEEVSEEFNRFHPYIEHTLPTYGATQGSMPFKASNSFQSRANDPYVVGKQRNHRADKALPTRFVNKTHEKMVVVEPCARQILLQQDHKEDVYHGQNEVSKAATKVNMGEYEKKFMRTGEESDYRQVGNDYRQVLREQNYPSMSCTPSPPKNDFNKVHPAIYQPHKPFEVSPALQVHERYIQDLMPTESPPIKINHQKRNMMRDIEDICAKHIEREIEQDIATAAKPDARDRFRHESPMSVKKPQSVIHKPQHKRQAVTSQQDKKGSHHAGSSHEKQSTAHFHSGKLSLGMANSGAKGSIDYKEEEHVLSDWPKTSFVHKPQKSPSRSPIRSQSASPRPESKMGSDGFQRDTMQTRELQDQIGQIRELVGNVFPTEIVNDVIRTLSRESSAEKLSVQDRSEKKNIGDTVYDELVLSEPGFDENDRQARKNDLSPVQEEIHLP